MSNDSILFSVPVKVTQKQMADIFKRYDIPACHRRCFVELVRTGKAKSGEFRRRLEKNRNYGRAVSAILSQLCEPLFHLFDWQR
jgi:hypothetical protein